MKFLRLKKTFVESEDGAVTVDWVVLTAAVVSLGVAALTLVRQGTGHLTTSVNSFLSSQSIMTTF